MTNYGAGELLNGFIEFFLSSNEKRGNLGLSSIKRGIRIDGIYYYPSLVFYNIALRCMLVVYIKKSKIIDNDIEKMKKILTYYFYNETAGCDNPPMGLIISPKKTIFVSYRKDNEFLLEENNNDNKLLTTNIENKYLKMQNWK